MSAFKPNNFTDRQKASAEAKKALLEKLRPKPSVTDPDFANREAQRQAELERVRQERAEARAAAKLIAEEKEAARRAEAAALEATELELKRMERKERKQVQKEIARAKKERLSAYKNFKVSA